MGSRLNDDEKIIESLINGTPCGYEDGLFACGDPIEENDEYTRQKLALDIFSTSYTDKINPNYMSKVVYVYGNKDEQGVMSDKEKNFIQDNKGGLLLWNQENHTSYLNNSDLIKEILNAIRK
jgi:hypothetical protein